MQTGQAREVIADALMTTKEVAALTRITPETLAWYRHVGDGRGPKWFRLGRRRVVYKRSDVIAWLDAAYAASPAEGKASA